MFSICTPAISTTRSSSRASSARCSMLYTTTSWKFLSPRHRIAPTAARRDCERSPPENRTGDSGTRPDSVLALHGTVPLRSRTRLLLPQRHAVRKSGGLLHFERRACGLRAPHGPPVRRDVAHSGLSGPHHVERTRARPRTLRAGCTRLVRKEVPGFLSCVALCSGRTFAGVARANRSDLEPT